MKAKHSSLISLFSGILMLLISSFNLQAQSTNFGLSELSFTSSPDSAQISGNTLIAFSFRISGAQNAQSIKLELANVMHDFTLHTISACFISENGMLHLEIDGKSYAIKGTRGTVYFELPIEIVEQWKFTRISAELLSGETSDYLYHRW